MCDRWGRGCCGNHTLAQKSIATGVKEKCEKYVNGGCEEYV